MGAAAKGVYLKGLRGLKAGGGRGVQGGKQATITHPNGNVEVQVLAAGVGGEGEEEEEEEEEEEVMEVMEAQQQCNDAECRGGAAGCTNRRVAGCSAAAATTKEQTQGTESFAVGRKAILLHYHSCSTPHLPFPAVSSTKSRVSAVSPPRRPLYFLPSVNFVVASGFDIPPR